MVDLEAGGTVGKMVATNGVPPTLEGQFSSSEPSLQSLKPSHLSESMVHPPFIQGYEVHAVEASIRTCGRIRTHIRTCKYQDLY